MSRSRVRNSASSSPTRGEFVFNNLPPGAYETRFELAGFAPTVAKVSVRGGGTERLVIKMQVAAVSETNIAIRDAQAKVQRESGVVGGVPVPMASPSGVGGGVGGGAYANFPGCPPSADFHTEAYDHFDDNTFRRVANDLLSTFSIDVDTASYANVRRFLHQGTFPPAVRSDRDIQSRRYTKSCPPASRSMRPRWIR